MKKEKEEKGLEMMKMKRKKNERITYRSTLGDVIDKTFLKFNGITIHHVQCSGFVFKLQANMDPRHRDRVAFVRVCSGKFEKDISVRHARSGRNIRLSRPQKLFGQEREVVEEAYPGDVIGLNNPGMFAIGDTLYVGPKVEYEGIPCFTPELFAWLRNPNAVKPNYAQGGRGMPNLGLTEAQIDDLVAYLETLN